MEENKKLGTVIWFSSKLGFGFIAPELSGNAKEKDIFVHFSDLNVDGFKTLNKDQRVSYEIGTNKHGQPKAISVTIVK